MYGVILGQDIPFPGGCPVPDACANLASGDCPIEAGEEFVWNMEMPIDSWFPGVSYFYYLVFFSLVFFKIKSFFRVHSKEKFNSKLQMRKNLYHSHCQFILNK